jgi:hypothetical protein
MAQDACECDFLIVGAGAQGMCFTDTVLTESKATVVIVDPRHRPGGHWHDACPFARLHQPSIYYGVGSKPLASKRVAATGTTQDERWERASRDEILSYFDGVMQAFELTGRVRYFPMCTYNEESGLVVPVLNQENGWPVTVRRKVVDTTHAGVRVPGSLGRGKPPFDVAPDARYVPANDLSRVIVAPHPKYVVIGAGRTGIDAVLWLLSNGVSPSMVQWVVPRDMWCFCREAMSPESFVDSNFAFWNAAVQAKSDEALCMEIERLGIWCRILDDDQAPCNRTSAHRNLKDTMAFHGVQVSKEELASLRQVTDIVRMGHVVKLLAEELHCENGSVPEAPGTLYIDCTSSWVREAPEPVTIFQEKKIILQFIQEVYNGVGDFNVCFHASLTAFLECHYPDSTEWKNSACKPAKPVDNHLDWLKSQRASFESGGRLWQEKRVAQGMVAMRPGCFASLRPDKLRKLMMNQGDTKKIIAAIGRVIQQAEACNGAKKPKTCTDTPSSSLPRQLKHASADGEEGLDEDITCF